MSPVLVNLIAAHRAATPDVLTYLLQHGATRRDLALVQQVAANPSLPAPLRAQLEQGVSSGTLSGLDLATEERLALLRTLMERHDMEFRGALKLARQAPAGALRIGMDVHGGRFALCWGAMDTDALVTFIDHPATPATLAQRAARRLAGYAHLGPHLRAFAAYFARHPRDIDNLLRHANPRARADLRAQAGDLGRAPAARGLPQSANHPRTTRHALLEHVRERPERWVPLLAHLHPHNVDDALARQALREGGYDVRVLHALTLNTHLSDEVRLPAQLALAKRTKNLHPDPGHRSTPMALEGITIPTSATSEWLEEYTSHEKNLGILRRVMYHPNLSTAVLNNLAHTFEDAELFAPDLWAEWMANLATHPQSTTAHYQRAHAGLTTREVHPPSVCADLAAAIGHLSTGTAAQRGCHLPTSVLNDPTLGALPGVLHMANAALADLLTTLPDGSGQVLVSLAADLHGSLADVLATVRAVVATAPCETMSTVAA